MRFNPEQTNTNLIPCGKEGVWCDALIEAAVDKHSKAGNQMIQASFRVYDPAGLKPTIDHYFVASAPGMLKKLCNALGMSGQFETGDISAADLLGKSVQVLVKIREDSTGEFWDKNVLSAFRSDAAPKDNGPSLANEPVKDDPSIPF